MPKIKTNGIDLYYEIHGRGDPLVLIMGLRRNAEWWYPQLPSLSKHFQVLVFDNRGAGRSDKPAMGWVEGNPFHMNAVEAARRLHLQSRAGDETSLA